MSSSHDRHGQHIYGSVHKAQRKRWARVVAAGGVACWRCGKPIPPVARWDLGHVEEEGRRRGFPVRHPEHRSCNRATVTHLREKLGLAPGLAKAGEDWVRVGPPNRWSRHWYGPYTDRCPDCRRLGRACDASVAMCAPDGGPEENADAAR
jgi:hypothetical protein